jgi:tetratricopeptide (TPR) repeat protein
MKTFYADYNAMTEAGHVCLTTRGSKEDIARAGLRPGDWVWLSDSEVVVGAQLAIDDRYGLVGVPDWDTIAHLDEEGADDYNRVSAALSSLVTEDPLPREHEPRVFELLTQYEHVAPSQVKNASPGTLALRRAFALQHMGKLGLALLEATEAHRARPGDVKATFVYLDLLRLEDFPAAVVEAEKIAESPSVPAPVLSACINILATQAEQAADDQFESIARQVFALCQRLDEAPDLEQAGPSLVALSYFNRGLVYLRSGRVTRAHAAFERAQQIYPEGPRFSEVRELRTYDRHAREVARSVRTIAEHWNPPNEVAA